MRKKELEEIIDSRLSAVDMTINSDAKNMIIGPSQGLPFYTHYFGLYSGYAALDHQRMNIEVGDVMDSTGVIIQRAFNIRTAHHKATASTHESLYAEVLLACALAKTDDMGYFAAADVSEPLSVVMGKQYEIPSYMRHLK